MLSLSIIVCNEVFGCKTTRKCKILLLLLMRICQKNGQQYIDIDDEQLGEKNWTYIDEQITYNFLFNDFNILIISSQSHWAQE